MEHLISLPVAEVKMQRRNLPIPGAILKVVREVMVDQVVMEDRAVTANQVEPEI